MEEDVRGGGRGGGGEGGGAGSLPFLLLSLPFISLRSLAFKLPFALSFTRFLPLPFLFRFPSSPLLLFLPYSLIPSITLSLPVSPLLCFPFFLPPSFSFLTFPSSSNNLSSLSRSFLFTFIFSLLTIPLAFLLYLHPLFVSSTTLLLFVSMSLSLAPLFSAGLHTGEEECTPCTIPFALICTFYNPLYFSFTAFCAFQRKLYSSSKWECTVLTSLCQAFFYVVLMALSARYLSAT